jgi:hypothetical protein
MHKFRTRLASLALATLMIAITSSSAHAATRTLEDRRGDAPASADVTRLTVVNGDTRVRATIRLRDARRSTVLQLAMNPQGPGYYYAIRRPDLDGRGWIKALYRVRGGEDFRINCAALRIRLRTAVDKAVVSFPQTCVGDKRSRSGFRLFTTNKARTGSDTVPNDSHWVYVRRG